MPRIEAEGGHYFISFALFNRTDRLTTKERETVYSIIRQGNGNRYELHAVAVMPDHVHMIVQAVVGDTPVPLAKIMHHIKGLSAYRINRLRGRKGPLWQRRSHNRLLITDYEYRQKMKYIYENPRKARLVKDPEDYPFLWYVGKIEDEEPR